MDNRPLIFFDPFPRTEPMVFTADVEAECRQIGRVVSHFGARAPDGLVESLLPEVDIIVGQTSMPRERLDNAPNLKAILNVKANWEPNIDYAEAHRRGIHVLSAAPAMAPAVAEYCLGQAISLLRGFAAADGLFRNGQEAYGIGGNGRARTLFGARAGLIGYGNLGRALAPLLRPFGCDLIVHDPWLSDRYLELEGLKPAALDTLLETSDVIFVLAGVTSENEGFLDRGKLEKIAPDASVVLASRAEVVEFGAFLDLAGQGKFRAAVDVFPEEPVASDAAFRATPNVLFTAHLAGGLEASYARIRDMMMDDIRQILKGLPPLRMQKAEPRQAAMARSR